MLRNFAFVVGYAVVGAAYATCGPMLVTRKR